MSTHRARAAASSDDSSFVYAYRCGNGEPVVVCRFLMSVTDAVLTVPADEQDWTGTGTQFPLLGRIIVDARRREVDKQRTAQIEGESGPPVIRLDINGLKCL
jgi:hypothetical protein